MGRRNADRIPISYYRRAVATVADMLREHWEVISKCNSCGLMMPVDLDLIAWRSGARTILWNRRARCKRIGCQGWVEFQARVPGVGFYQTLSSDDGERER
ncbi:MAG TPA: hypothetical protein VHZ26_09115 [Caulobacteraceae bacterium]|jgi:hypothetical protein|nr:hypothetical protein [Caulobacteraceae bacterium]